MPEMHRWGRCRPELMHVTRWGSLMTLSTPKSEGCGRLGTNLPTLSTGFRFSLIVSVTTALGFNLTCQRRKGSLHQMLDFVSPMQSCCSHSASIIDLIGSRYNGGHLPRLLQQGT